MEVKSTTKLTSETEFSVRFFEPTVTIMHMVEHNVKRSRFGRFLNEDNGGGEEKTDEGW